MKITADPVQLRGGAPALQKMVEDDKCCIDIPTRVSAATRALQSVALGLLEDHLAHCVTEAAAAGGGVAAAKVREAADAIARLDPPPEDLPAHPHYAPLTSGNTWPRYTPSS
jgi:CsoR family transcriptional regulator, copper-sensing transcriptional repressor